MERQFVVGFIRGSHGLSGECKIESTSGYFDHIVALKDVTLRHGDKTKLCKVENAYENGTCAFMKFAEINSLEEIKKYNKWEIVVPRECAHSLKKDEWYIEDLKNCSLVYERNSGVATNVASIEKIGIITDVLEGGAAELLEVRLSEDCNVIEDNIKFTCSGKIRTVFVPFTDAHIGKVDIETKTVQLMHLWILE